MKNTSLWIRTAIILIITLIGAYLVFGPRGSVDASDFTWQGIKNNLAENIDLGLDLRGGSSLVLRVKTDEYLAEMTKNNRDAALNAAKEASLPVTDATYVAEKNNYSVTLQVSDPAQRDRVIEEVQKKVDFVTSWQPSGSGNTVTWTLPVQNQGALKRQATEQVLKIIDSRINAFGVKEPTLQQIGSPESGQILLQMPGVENPERVKELVGRASKLEMVKIVSPPSPSPLQTYPTREAALASIGGIESGNRKVLPYYERDDAATTDAGNQPQQKPPPLYVVVEYPAVVGGNELRDASATSPTQNPNGSDFQINFSFKPTGAQKFGEWTGKNINNYMGVVLDNEVKSAAYIRSQIFDQGQIDGRFTQNAANDLVLTLKSGALPAGIAYQEERTVGPSLGADSIRAGVSASVGGLIFVIIFMLIYYRGSGVNAVIALLLNMLLTMAALVMFGSTLTLPGIAGLILGIGMAVDSNVLIFERMREELRAGKAAAEAVSLGFDRAFVTIIDTHITTILSSVILYLYGSGPIRGFAVTLILGLLINLFSAVFVSRTIFLWLLSRNPNMKKISI